uniref:Uncharacterized protein n=1 Tax=Heterorhabditis bacteriophora TaxID=37862 RepID=A0A1I7WC83_HETBA
MIIIPQLFLKEHETPKKAILLQMTMTCAYNVT